MNHNSEDIDILFVGEVLTQEEKENLEKSGFFEMAIEELSKFTDQSEEEDISNANVWEVSHSWYSNGQLLTDWGILLTNDVLGRLWKVPK